MTGVLPVLCGLALLPVVLGLVNLLFFRRLPEAREARAPLSVLVPARDEAGGISACLRAILDQPGVELEVLVYDDDSDDDTAEIVSRHALEDPRVTLVSGATLPAGWNGKQHACDHLGRRAQHPWLLFLDADVRLEPESLGRLAAAAAATDVALLSGFPRQTTGSFLERLLIPLMHFLLLGYLPFIGMRWSRRPAFGAGCGQLFLARRDAWLEVGGHGAIRASRHDGVTLPRAFRRGGFSTMVFDASDLARCRMYSGAAAVWTGLQKNADEGLATPVGIWVWTVLLLGGQVTPLVLLSGWSSPWLGLAVAGPLAFRALLAARLGQSGLGALLHPLGVTLLVVLQWQARFRAWRGTLPAWRGRPAASEV